MSWVCWEKASAGRSGRGELWKWRSGLGGKRVGWRKRCRRIRLMEIDGCPCRLMKNPRIGPEGWEMWAVSSLASRQLCSTRAALTVCSLSTARWPKEQKSTTAIGNLWSSGKETCSRSGQSPRQKLCSQGIPSLQAGVQEFELIYRSLEHIRGACMSKFHPDF